jgi:hypothetical protein
VKEEYNRPSKDENGLWSCVVVVRCGGVGAGTVLMEADLRIDEHAHENRSEWRLPIFRCQKALLKDLRQQLGVNSRKSR